MNSFPTLTIHLDFIEKGLTLTIDVKKPDSLFDCFNAEQEGECRYQLKEGHFYDYEFSKPNYVFKNTDNTPTPTTHFTATAILESAVP